MIEIRAVAIRESWRPPGIAGEKWPQLPCPAVKPSSARPASDPNLSAVTRFMNRAALLTPT